MRFRTTLILLVLVLLAGAYLWYYDRERPSTAEQKLTEKRIFRDFDPDKVTQLSVTVQQRTNETGAVTNVQSFAIERGVDGWNTTQPVNFPADETKVRAILDQVKKIDTQRRIVAQEYAALDRTNAGLIDPDITATFDLLATSLTLNVGFEVPGLWANYVEVPGRAEAYFVPSQFKDALTLTTDSGTHDVRRRAVFNMRAYQVSGLIVERPHETIELRRGNDAIWRLLRPLADAANHKAVEKTLEDLEKLAVSAFIDPPADFGAPRATITLIQNTTSQRLEIGNEISGADDHPDAAGRRPTSLYMARRAEYQQFFTLRKKDIAPLLEPSGTFRDMRLFVTYDYHQPVRLRQQVGGTALEMTSDHQWTLIGFASPLMDATKVDNYVYEWLDFPVTNFPAAATARAALSNAWITLGVDFKESEEVQTTVISAPRDGLCYAERSPDVFVALDAAAVAAHLATNELPFLTDELFDTPAVLISRVEFDDDTGHHVFARSTNQWTEIVSNGIVQVDLDVAELIHAALPLPVARWIAKVEESGLARFGLETPVYTWLIETDNHARTQIRVGAPADADGRYAMVVGEPYVGIIRNEALEKLLGACAAFR